MRYIGTYFVGSQNRTINSQYFYLFRYSQSLSFTISLGICILIMCHQINFSFFFSSIRQHYIFDNNCCIMFDWHNSFCTRWLLLLPTMTRLIASDKTIFAPFCLSFLCTSFCSWKTISRCHNNRLSIVCLFETHFSVYDTYRKWLKWFYTLMLKENKLHQFWSWYIIFTILLKNSALH